MSMHMMLAGAKGPGGGGDPGNGGGFSVAQGASNTSGTYTSHSPITTRHVGYYNLHGVSNDFFEYPGGGFGMHTGHGGGSNVWPLNMAVQVSTAAKGQVIDTIDWKKHGNACGNTDIWGSNQSITGSNYTDESKYTYLGRINFGGQGTGNEGTILTRTFNANQYGYQWYMMKIVDGAPSLAYPQEGIKPGWAMYGMRWRKS